jgi:hypothetical protein
LDSSADPCVQNMVDQPIILLAWEENKGTALIKPRGFMNMEGYTHQKQEKCFFLKEITLLVVTDDSLLCVIQSGNSLQFHPKCWCYIFTEKSIE